MNSRGSALIYAGLILTSLSCLAFLLVCPHRADCIRSLTEAATWLRYGGEVVLPLVAASTAAWMLRVGWLLILTWRWSRRLAVVPTPPVLRFAAERAGIDRLVTVREDLPEAICIGAIKPRVIVTDSLAAVLDAPELEAVLVHESDHAKRREPLMRAMVHAAAEVFLYVPLVRWLGQRRIEESELRADRVALEQLGPRPVAGALWVLGKQTAIQGAAAFGGVADLRVAQVLGEPLRRQRLNTSTVAISALGGYLAMQTAACLFQALAHF